MPYHTEPPGLRPTANPFSVKPICQTYLLEKNSANRVAMLLHYAWLLNRTNGKLKELGVGLCLFRYSTGRAQNGPGKNIPSRHTETDTKCGVSTISRR